MNRHSNRLAVPTLVAALAAPALAQSIQFTDHCSNNTSSAERDIIRAAYEFAYEHRYDLWNEIDRRRAAGNVDGYEDVSDTRRNRWLREIESVKMNCEITGCRNHSTLWGHCGISGAGFGVLNPWDSTAVCVDNLQALATSLGHTSAVAYVAGTMAHEVMHQCDGWEGHPSGGTVANNPETDAETVGIAMEHMALTPDLEATITRMQQKVSSSGSAYLELTVRIDNENDLSGPTNATGRSGRSRHASTTLAVYLDGALQKQVSVGVIAGGASSEKTITLGPSEGYRPDRASCTVRVDADCNDVLTEYDEANNDDTETFDPDCDLAITRFQIAGPYTTVFYAGGTARRLDYDVEVANQSASNQSPATVLRQIGPVASRLSVTTTTQDHSVPSLLPGAVATFRITVDVPKSVTSGIYGSLWLGVDPDVTLRDEERANNEQSLVYTDSYFRPDYTVWFDALGFAEGGGVLVSFTVKNLGPEAGDSCQARLSASSGTPVARTIAALEPAASASYQFELADCIVLVGTRADFTLTVDSRRSLLESDEDNNVATAWLQNGRAIGELTDLMDLILPLEQPVWIDTARYGWIEAQLHLEDRFLWTHTRYSASGPFLERPSAWFLATEVGTVLVSFVSPQRTVPVLQQFAAAERVGYDLLRLASSLGPSGQSFWQ